VQPRPRLPAALPTGLDHSVAYLVATCVGLPVLLLVVWLIGGLQLRSRYCCCIVALYIIASLLLVALRWGTHFLTSLDAQAWC
jgi:hypothetical protein